MRLIFVTGILLGLLVCVLQSQAGSNVRVVTNGKPTPAPAPFPTPNTTFTSATFQGSPNDRSGTSNTSYSSKRASAQRTIDAQSLQQLKDTLSGKSWSAPAPSPAPKSVEAPKAAAAPKPAPAPASAPQAAEAPKAAPAAAAAEEREEKQAERNLPSTASQAAREATGREISTSSLSPNSESTRQINTESVAERVARLDRDGSDNFHKGAMGVAKGITKLSEAGQEQAASGGANLEVAAVHDDAIKQISEGSQQLEAGRAAVTKANEIKAQQNNLASIGVGTTFKANNLKFDAAKASGETKSALDDLEKIAGVSASALAEAVNQGGSDAIAELATTAKDVTDTKEEVVAKMSDFPVSGGLFASSAAPSRIVGSESSFKPQWIETPRGATAVIKATENRAPASTGGLPVPEQAGVRAPPVWAKANGLDSYNGSLQPLVREQLFETLDEKNKASRDEAGETIDTLFRRVKRQYTKRHEEMADAEARPAPLGTGAQ